MLVKITEKYKWFVKYLKDDFNSGEQEKNLNLFLATSNNFGCIVIGNVWQWLFNSFANLGFNEKWTVRVTQKYLLKFYAVPSHPPPTIP
jgi:hypothetical protein